MSSDSFKLETAVVLFDFEKELKQWNDPHFLVKVRDLLGDGWEASYVVTIGLDGWLELSDLSFA